MYLDCASTNKISNIWINSIIQSNSKGLYGNPGSYHKLGFDALDMMEKSTRNILKYVFQYNEVNEDYDICYNSGSTESINQFLYAFSKKSNSFIIYENVAHKAVLESVKRYFPNNNFKLQFNLSVDENVELFEEYLNNQKDKYENFLLVLTSVNNETGGIWNPNVKNKLSYVIKKYKNKENDFLNPEQLTLFLDHTQGFMKENGYLDLADAFCFSAHKIGGAKSFGGLVYKKELKDLLIENPLIVGGYEIRGGTKDPISVKALEDLVYNKYIYIDVNRSTVSLINRDIKLELEKISKECNVDITFNTYSNFFADQSPYIINASFIGIEGESLMSSLIDDCISTGSACNSSELKTSHVLTGLGKNKLTANCAFRISIDEDIDKNELHEFLLNRLKPAVKFLARMRTRHGEN